MQALQSAPIPLLSSILHAHNRDNPINFQPKYITDQDSMPIKTGYSETAISTELECFIQKTSSSDCINNVNYDDNDDDDSFSTSSSESISFETQTKQKNKKNDDELIEIDLNETNEAENSNKHHTTNHNHNHHRHRHHHHHQRTKKKRHHETLCNKYIFGSTPSWILHLNNLDKSLSSSIHKLSFGTIDYLFVFGAFVFGSKFMPITILISIFIVEISGFLFLLIACAVTVSITQILKKMIGRHRPDPKSLAMKILDFRTRLTNYAFPSGDTAQAAAYATSLYFLTSNVWLLLLIPNCAWSRIYFGCHFVGDCIFGAMIGFIVPLILWNITPHHTFIHTQQTIQDWMH